MDELEEIIGDEAGAADEGAVDVRLGDEVAPVGGIDAAAIQDAEGFKGGVVVELGHETTDGADGFVGLLGGGVEAGADGPDGLVGDDDTSDFGGGDFA